MSAESTLSLRPSLLYTLLAGIAGLLVVFLYSLGLDGGWMFDDEFSLKGLARVVDLSTAADYVFSGSTGPSGRWLALASFVINAADWPGDPGAFRMVNVALHLINGTLLYFVVLALARQASHARAWQVALTASALWLLSPLLASSVLSVVQRMTLLAATCTLLGLLGYLHARKLLASRPWLGLSLMSLALLLGAGLGVMAKECAALLPLYAAVIEFCFPARRSARLTDRLWASWRIAFFVMPLLILATYTVLAWPGFESTYRMRSFDLGQRLASETVILWDYVRQLALPQPRGMGLFQDDWLPRTWTEPVVWAAVGAWLAVALAAVVLRKRTPWFSLAIGGFLVGHLLESTVIPLELYFEHRNYVPAMFICAGAAALLWQQAVRLAAFVSIVFGVVLAASLANVTTLWGRSDVAAEIWFEAHPGSSRAAQFVSQQRLLAGFDSAARQAIYEALEHAPLSSDLLLQGLVFDCGALKPAELRQRGEELVGILRQASHSWAALDALKSLDAEMLKGRCAGMPADIPPRLAEALLANSHFATNSQARDHLHNFLAANAFARGDLDAAERHQRAAYAAVQTASNAKLVAVRLLQRNDTDGAIAFLEAEMARHAAKRHLPNGWQREVGDMLVALRQVRGGSAGPNR
jgi:hypothetical protein